MLGGHRLQNEAASFQYEERGNVAMMWALMGAVLVGLVGMSVDFTRAQALRNQMQNAADGAALVAERSANLPLAQRSAAAEAFFDAEMGDMAPSATFTLHELESGGHEVEANMPMPVSLARIIQNRDWNIAVNAVAEANASPPIEVALVLDNTGSMANDMQGLRDAAHNLASDLLALDGDTVKVALVPFVAQVNIGNQPSHLAWMDQAGTAPMNGELLEDRMIAFRPTNGGLGVLGNCNHPVTPAGYPGPYTLTWAKQGLRCHAFTPSDGINYFTLFDRISNEDWKGCVEARPEPFDITDAAPVVGNPATMFVPFFWLDTGGNAGQGSSNNTNAVNYLSSNSYLSDTAGDIGGGATMSTSNGLATTAQDQREARFFNVFKYRNTAASIDISAPDTRGPNRGCPTPIVPLTADDGTVLSNIAAMQHWSGGGTNQAEGLAWGWRVLSPTAPFTEGAPYGADVRKVIVLMSDGENTNVGNDPVMGSDYSAYNHMGFWRDVAAGDPLTQLLFGLLHGILPPQFRRDINSANQYVTYVNNREAQLCTNIKNAGIEIYTVIFRETDPATQTLMRNCATSPQHFYRADNAAELSAAFDAIGSGIGQLRLTH